MERKTNVTLIGVSMWYLVKIHILILVTLLAMTSCVRECYCNGGGAVCVKSEEGDVCNQTKSCNQIFINHSKGNSSFNLTSSLKR